MPKVDLIEAGQWGANMANAHTMCMINEDYLIVRGTIKEDDSVKVINRIFQIATGTVLRDLNSQCNHQGFISNLCKHPIDEDCVLEACFQCSTVTSYNIKRNAMKIVLNDNKIKAICNGPSNTLLALDETSFTKQLLLLEWQKENDELKVIKTVKTNITEVNRIC